jgi:hypothetical protein
MPRQDKLFFARVTRAVLGMSDLRDGGHVANDGLFIYFKRDGATSHVDTDSNKAQSVPVCESLVASLATGAEQVQ